MGDGATAMPVKRLERPMRDEIERWMRWESVAVRPEPVPPARVPEPPERLRRAAPRPRPAKEGA